MSEIGCGRPRTGCWPSGSRSWRPGWAATRRTPTRRPRPRATPRRRRGRRGALRVASRAGSRVRRGPRCVRSLTGAPVTSTETRQVADLPEVALRWVEHRIEHRECGCGATTMAGTGDGVPSAVRAPVSYGPGVRAVATYLVAGHHLPLARAVGHRCAHRTGYPVAGPGHRRGPAPALAVLDSVLHPPQRDLGQVRDLPG